VSVDGLIYGLIDPRTLLIRYVGKSLTGLRRPQQHRHCNPRTSGPHCINWIKQLLAEGFCYEIAILDHGRKEILSVLERYWIAFGRACGWPLTNLTAGGDGFSGVVTAAHRAKLSAALTGHLVSAATRAKQAAKTRAQMQRPEARAALSNRTFTLEWRAKISAARKVVMQDPAEREKIAASQRGRTFTEDHRAHVCAAARKRKATKLTLVSARDAFLAVRQGEAVRVVAARYGVSPRCIQDVLAGRRWKEIFLQHGGAE